MAEQINYTDDNIITLEGVEHIRMRPGMYIGRLGNGNNQGDGIYVLLKEVVDNSIDEFAMGFGKQVQIQVENGEVSVRDFGRGIPLDSVVKAVSILNTGGKFDDKAFKKSVGLNGVGTKAVNALSERFYVCSYRDGECSWARFERGELIDSGKDSTKEKNGTLVRFYPDTMMFGDFHYNMDYVETMVKNYSYLKRGLTLVLNGTSYKSENGLLDLVNENLSEEPLYPPIHLEGEDIEIVLSHGNAYGENIASFVNGQNTRDGGTHLAAYREAIAKTLKDFFKKNYEPADCRQGIVGAISIQIQEPNFEGQTKTKLGSNYMWEKQTRDEKGALKTDIGPTIRSFVNDFVSKNLDNYLRIHKEIVPVIEDKIKASQQEREEISGIQKKTRERNKRSNIYNKKLRDCLYHFNDKVTEKTQEACAKLAAWILDHYNIPLDHLLRHGDITTKHCPSPYIDNPGDGPNWTWAKFKARVAEYMGGSVPEQELTPEQRVVATGQRHSVNYTGHQIDCDGVYGKESRKNAVRCLQRAANVDWNAGLSVDGIIGDKTRKAFEGHFIKRGERQDMVTAVEIIMYMRGRNPNGVEVPGVFGAGLAKALGTEYITGVKVLKLVD